MKRGIAALLTAVFVGGIGIAQAAVVTNYYEDFTGTVSNVVSTVGGGEAMTNGLPYNTWMLGADGNENSAAYTNAPTLSFFTRKDDSGAAYYTLPSATLGAAASMALTVDLSFLSADKLHLVVYGVDNPVVTTNNYVEYDAISRNPGGFEANDLGLFVVGSTTNVVTELIPSTAYTATGLITTAYFDYNGTDDVVIGLTAEKNGNTKKFAKVNSVLLFSDDNPVFPAELTLVAEDIGVTSDFDVASGSVDVSYTEGSAATNVVITEVSVIGQTHSNAFSNTTSLPLTVNDPAPSSDTLSISFDNGIAGLAVTESATGTVQVVWNEEGSATSYTSSVPIVATYPEVNDNNIIAVWDTAFFGAPDRALDGMVAKVSGGNKRGGRGSTDGSYGTLSGNAPTVGGSRRVNEEEFGLVISVVLTNETLGNVTFDTLHFDASRYSWTGPTNILVEMSGDVTASTLTNIAGLARVGDNMGDYPDFDLPLTNLADHVLAPGEGALITFTFSGGSATGESMIDNIALLMAPMSAFEKWANGAGLSQGVNDDPSDNPDGDSMDNLMEYATNGDPLTPDAAAETFEAVVNTTNWFYYVWDKRIDDGGLAFSLGLSTDLVNDTAWGDTGLEFVGQSGKSGGFRSVTNRTDIDTAEFIRLKVEQD